jgi:YcaO-like protein with predicted kinase domain
MTTTTQLSRSPEDTLEAIVRCLKHAGVTRLAEITGMDSIGIPCYSSIRPDAKSLAVDSGKGITKVQAKCSAAMESLERWALDDVEIEHHLTRFSERPRYPLNKGAVVTGKHKACCAYNLDNDDTVLVPYYTVKLYDEGTTLQDRCWYATTNGMAAASTREEAIQGALHEVIERDGCHLAMIRALKGAQLPRVDPDSIPGNLIEKIEDAGAQIFVFDCRTEIQLPTFMAILTDLEKGLGIWRGYGAHRDPFVAVNRAICEAAQSRCVVLSGARDEITWAKHRKLVADSAALDWGAKFSEQKPVITLEDIAESDPQLDGRPVLVVDFPLPRDWPLSVVKVLVPGLAGYWAPYAEEGRP